MTKPFPSENLEERETVVADVCGGNNGEGRKGRKSSASWLEPEA